MCTDRIVWLHDENGTDPAQVGVKNARLAWLARDGIQVPAGFAVTAAAYAEFVRAAGLAPVIAQQIRRYRSGTDLIAVAAAIRTAFCEAPLPPAMAGAILAGYEELGGDGTEVAVRSSAIETQDAVRDEVFLHLRSGADVLAACRRCFASLFSDVALGNREYRAPNHLAAAMPVAVERMVRSDLGGSGTVHGENTFVRIHAAWGLGQPPADDPDQYSVHPGARPMIVKHRGAKPTKTVYAGPRGTRQVLTTPEERSRVVLTDEEIQELGRWSVTADARFSRRMVLEWARDGQSGKLFAVEARPLSLPSAADDNHAAAASALPARRVGPGGW